MWRTAVAIGVVGAMTLTGCGGEDESAAGDGGGDLQAMCEQMATIEGPEDLTVERLDQLLEVAVDEVRPEIQFIRDRVAEDGEAAFEDEAVGERIEQVATFEGMECGES